MAEYSPEVINPPSARRIAFSIGGREELVFDKEMLGSFLQSSIFHRISNGYSSGRVAGWKGAGDGDKLGWA